LQGFKLQFEIYLVPTKPLVVPENVRKLIQIIAQISIKNYLTPTGTASRQWMIPAWSFFTRVGTYVQRGSKFCFVVVLLVGESLIKILHYCPISPCFQHIFAPLHTALPGSLARACPAARRALLSRQV
jgi:hypothetical protein